MLCTGGAEDGAGEGGAPGVGFCGVGSAAARAGRPVDWIGAGAAAGLVSLSQIIKAAIIMAVKTAADVYIMAGRIFFLPRFISGTSSGGSDTGGPASSVFSFGLCSL